MQAVLDREFKSICDKLPEALSQAQKDEIAQRSYHHLINGVSHQQLTDMSFGILVNNLTGFGNVLSVEHKQALYELLMNYTKMIQGRTVGRLAFGLDTGMGKTESVVALMTAIHQLKLDHVSILVCQSKVEGLCELKRKLIAKGIPEDKIGLIHSYDYDEAKLVSGVVPEGCASMPSTSKAEQRQFQLVTHNRVKGVRDILEFNTYNDNARSLVIWDESLLASDAYSITEAELDKAVHNFCVDNKHKPTHQGVIDYLTQTFSAIQAGFSKDKSSTIQLAKLDSETLGLYRKLFSQSHEAYASALIKLLDMSMQELRLLTTKDGRGVITYKIAVPKELNKVIILDASWWIRELERLDGSISSDTHFIHPKLKRYDNVTVRQMLFSGSRTNLTADMSGKSEQRKVSKEIASVIKATPLDEAILIFTYKRRGQGVDFVSTLKSDLTKMGIDIDATVNVQGNLKPRISFLTWGSETSLNEYSYCNNVILAGILHRSHVDIAAAIAGQSDDLNGSLQHEDIKRVLDSEMAHLAFQALSRGTCRKVNNGYAAPMTAWVIHRSLDLKPTLESVMSGCKWLTWDEVDPVNKGVIDRTAQSILVYLDGLGDSISKLSTSQLKQRLNLSDVSKTSWTSALNRAVKLTNKWCLQSRSLIRVSLHDQYFTS